ncbi:MAG: DUF72 domain-containing protein [Alphaproteobacteria bacterium]|nr:DUF72 domain-containing protein [Alphaproteobacteria bacterium]
MRPAELPADLHALGRRLPPTLRLGTSSWTFPGWSGLVWAGEPTPEALAREGLTAYARHPLLRTVGIDRTWYAPMDVQGFAAYAAQVPEDFRFLVKLPSACTTPRLPDGAPNPRFLDAAWAADHGVAPAVEGLGARLGPILVQLPPLAPDEHGPPEPFVARLGRFLEALPPVLRAVEVRSRGLYVRGYADALRAAGAVHCVNVFPGMPTVATQARVAAAVGGPAVVARWMLHPALRYAEAKAAFAPFHAIGRPHPEARDGLAELLATAARDGRPAWVIANNKAEGSAPRSLEGLARAVATLLHG